MLTDGILTQKIIHKTITFLCLTYLSFWEGLHILIFKKNILI